MPDNAIIQQQLDELEAHLHARLTGSAATRIRESDREMELQRVSEAEIRARINELKSSLGQSPRIRSRRVVF